MLTRNYKRCKNGFWVEPENPEQIADKALSLLNDELSKRILKKNKEEVKKYSWENVAKRRERIYLCTLCT